MDYEVLDPVQHELVIKNEFDAPEINPALAFIATLHRGTSRYTMTSKLNVVARWAGAKDLRYLNWSARSCLYYRDAGAWRGRKAPHEPPIRQLLSVRFERRREPGLSSKADE